MNQRIQILLFGWLITISNLAYSCNGFTPAVTTNTYIGNGEYLLSIDICEFVSNSDGLGDFAAVHGILITVNGANVTGINTASITGITSGVAITPTQTGVNQVEYGDWGNSAAPVFLAYGDPQECWTIELIVDGGATTVDVWGSSSESAIQPGIGMSDNGGIWGCGSGLNIPPAVCDASWTPPTLCAGTTPIDLNTSAPGTGVYSGTGVNSGTGMFDPTGLTGDVAVSYTIGDAFFNCTVVQNITITEVLSPTLSDSTICAGDAVDLDGSITPPPPPPPAIPCTYSIGLEDTYGDGWQGGSVTVLVDGVAVLSGVTLAGGYGPVFFDFDVFSGQSIVVNYSAGIWSSENHYTVFDGAAGTGSAIFTGTVGLTPPGAQNITNPCTVVDNGGGGSGGSCAYTLVFEDSYGDGWQGAFANIYINGVLFLANQTVPNCGIGPCIVNIPIPVNDGDVILINYTQGAWNTENTIYLYDNDNILVNSINNPPNGNLGSGITTSCPPTDMTYTWSPPLGLSDPNIADPTATPGVTTAYTLTITDPASSCTSQSQVTITIGCTLPVELTYFNGNCIENNVELNWETSSETNTDYFAIQYSNNGELFSTVGEIQSVGYSTDSQKYQYSNEGVDGYYRLRQVDIDGTYRSTNPIFIECDNNSAYGSVLNGIISIHSENAIEKICILDMTGRVIYKGTETTIDIGNHSSSIYFVEINTLNSTERIKIINPQ